MPELKQLEMEFASPSPINTESLSKQNKIIFDWLSSGKTINHIEAMDLGVYFLHSRISDLRNKHGVGIHSWFETTSGGSSVKRYSFHPKPEAAQ